MTLMGPIRDMEHAEARRRERAERLHRPYGREMSRRSRLVASSIAIIVLVGMLILVVLDWLNLEALRTPA